MTLHIVYPYGQRAAAPWSIGNNLAWAARRRGYEVAQYDWEEPTTIVPAEGDVLLGHPHPSLGGYAFNRSLDAPQWKRRYAICPWNGSEEYTQQVARVIDHVDRFFAICGPYWGERIPAPWAAKTTRLDMAVDPRHYPRVKRELAPAGQRRFLYIGCTLPCKGTDYLTEVIAATGGEWGHIGPGAVPGCKEHGYVPLETDAGRRIVADYDILVMPGRHDANPTTVLEAECWGLVPVVAQTCGWDDRRFLPMNAANAGEALRLLRDHPNTAQPEVPGAPYDWNTFTSRVLDALEN